MSFIVVASLVVYNLGTTPANAQYGATDGEWHAYGGDIGSTKYSPLDQISRNNFSDLEVSWRWKSADAFLSTTTPDGGEWWTSLSNIVDSLESENPNLYRNQNTPRISSM